MTRTQIYLTPFEAQGVARVAAETGRKQSEVIREAIDQYLKRLGRGTVWADCGKPAVSGRIGKLASKRCGAILTVFSSCWSTPTF